MKKCFMVPVFFATTVFCFSQTLDDLAYSNSDMMTLLQQEMTSLMRFQFKNDINIPFFLSITGRSADLEYKPEYLESLYSGTGIYSNAKTYINFPEKTNYEFAVSYGMQFKLNNTLYLPIFGIAHRMEYSSYINNEWIYLKDEVEVLPLGTTGEERAPLLVHYADVSGFFGSGLHINTDNIKGGIYFGINILARERITDRLKMLTTMNPKDSESPKFSPKIALAPLVNTSNWAYIGKALNNILGFLGTGDNVISYSEDAGASIGAFADAINAGLDLTFNKIQFSPLSLQANAVYSRANYDAAAKNNMYGLKLQGLFSYFPFGFSLEGGYRQFFSVAKYLEPDYPNTGYINGSIFFPFKRITVGMIYQYDNIYKSKFTIAVSTNFLSAFYTHNPVEQFMNTEKFTNGTGVGLGFRYRHGGWRVK
jgi:hypothetical protein